MASQISVQKVVEPNSWLLLGAPTASSVILLNATEIRFSDGTVDTLPANTEALLVGGGTSFDRSTDVYVLFAYKGDGTLRVEKESRLFLLTQDYAPLGRILHGEIVPYQPVPSLLAATLLTGSWSGGALIGTGHALRGGGYHGVFDRHSMRGGGSVSGVPYYYSTANLGSPQTRYAFYLKVASAPAGDTCLVDWDFGGGNYSRVKLTSALHVVHELKLQGIATSYDFGAITTGTWHYVGATNSPVTDARTAAAGGLDGGFGRASQQIIAYGPFSYTGVLGWGVDHSAGYLNFPNSAGNEMSKLYIDVAGNTDNIAPYTSDPGGGTANYPCTDPLGAAAALLDQSGNSYDLTAGPNGLTVVSDSPYP